MDGSSIISSIISMLLLLLLLLSGHLRPDLLGPIDVSRGIGKADGRTQRIAHAGCHFSAHAGGRAGIESSRVLSPRDTVLLMSDCELSEAPLETL